MSSPVIILGMHRSGTSCLAGILRHAGIDFHNAQTSNPHNTKGNIENQAVVDLNNALLEYNNGSWDAPPDLVHWPEMLRRRRDELIGQLATGSTWGFKDPRTLFTLAGWLEALPEARCLGTFRHPAAVAMSLQKRNGFSLQTGLSLWRRYNRRLLALWRRERFPLVCFDQGAAEYLANVRAAMAAIDCAPSANGTDGGDFFSDALRHHKDGATVAVDAESLALYEVLRRAAGLSAPAGPRPRISVVVAAFNMRRELPRTLESLTPGYQRGVTGDEYEVIVVDNGSRLPLSAGEVAAFGPNFRALACPDPQPSPCGAMNFAARQSRGEIVGLHIDGARILSPGILRKALDAFEAYSANALALTTGRHCGPAPQQESRARGYDTRAEDALLAASGWEYDGYLLFRHSVPAQSARNGLFAPMPESNCLFLHRDVFERLGGFDTAFDLPGGGLANHDLLARALELPALKPVLLLGEATFHQVHDSSSTGAAPAGDSPWERYERQYQALRGKPYSVPAIRPGFLGDLPEEAEEDMLHSARLLAAEREKRAEESAERLVWLGFHSNEKGWRWMSEQGAIVQRPSGPDVHAVELVLRCGDSRHYSPFPFVLTVRTYDQELHISFEKSGDRKKLRLRVRPDEQRVLVRLRSGASFVPAELNLSQDSRRLSVTVSGVAHFSEEAGGRTATPGPEKPGTTPLARVLSRIRNLLK